MRKKLLLLLILVFQFTKYTYGRELSEFSEIYLLTYLPGEELYSLFGHSALRVRDPLEGIDHVYNYGTFDFSTPFFYIKFINGNLNYQLSKTRYSVALQQMRNENRSVLEQRLSLTLEEKNELFRQLETEYLPENRYYKYRFFKNNCSTKIRDIVESSVGDSIKYESRKKQVSFRNLIHKYLEEKPWVKLGIDLMLGRKADSKANSRETMFIPDYLTYHFALATVKRKDGIRSLATRPERIVQNNTVHSFQFLKPSAFFIAALVVLLILTPKFYPRKTSSKPMDIVIYGVTTIYAVIVVYVTLTSNHPELHSNYNLLWSLPAAGILLVQSITKNKKTKVLPFLYVIYSLIVLGVMLGNRWIPQHIPMEIYPFLIILIIHSGLKAVKLI
jgi:hypothetical protein